MAIKKTAAEVQALAIRTMRRRARGFEKLTPSKKRVAIALDVIAQLDAKRFKAQPGTYVALRGRVDIRDDAQQVCELTAGRGCHVCALGALFVAGVERADKLLVRDDDELRNRRGTKSISGELCRDYLTRFFAPEQLGDIERAFERWVFIDELAGHDPEERMRLIMGNIVANRGRFNPGRWPKRVPA